MNPLNTFVSNNKEICEFLWCFCLFFHTEWVHLFAMWGFRALTQFSMALKKSLNNDYGNNKRGLLNARHYSQYLCALSYLICIQSTRWYCYFLLDMCRLNSLLS